ncbi:MAG: alcohol dehydrogenase catalytic domain-containing protein [Thermoleophilia bacterium]
MLEEPKRFAVGQRPTPEPGDGEVRVRVHDCGVCGSDLKMWSGTHAFLRPPLLIGHEIYGIVEALGPGAQLGIGTPVVVFPALGCGHCYHCLAGKQQLCADMRFFGGQLPGGLAEHVVIPEANLLVVSAGVPETQRVLIEPLAVAVHGVARADVRTGETAIVLGGGAIGLFTALVARERGLDPILVSEPSASRRERATALGLRAFDPTMTPLAEIVAEHIRPEGADVVFEAVGSGETIGAALAATRKGGRAVIVGNAPAELEIDGLALQRGDRSLIGVLMYDLSDLTEAMRLLQAGLLAALPDESIVQPFTLEQVGAAFATAKDGSLEAIRAVVRP